MNQLIEESYKKEQTICLMCSDPDNLGAALVCHFLMNASKKSKDRKVFTSSSAQALVKDRRMQIEIGLPLMEVL